MNDAESKIYSYLKNKLSEKREIVRKKYDYYEGKIQVRDLNLSTPANMQHFSNPVGWCKKSVDNIAHRLMFEGFDNEDGEFVSAFQDNNQGILTKAAIKGAIIGGCSFFYNRIDNKKVKIQVIDGMDATGIIDPETHMLKYGYAVIEKDVNGKTIKDAFFTENEVIYTDSDGSISIVPTNGICWLVPCIYQPDATQPFGYSRITRASMGYVDGTMRTLKGAEISREFYSYPQKYITGLATDAELLPKWSASMSALMQFTKDEDGDSPNLGQFQQQSMEPHLEQIKMYASLFAGENDMTLDDLGFSTGNPASEESIRAAHESLRATAKYAQSGFETCFKNEAYVAKCLQDDMHYDLSIVSPLVARWAPMFEPDAKAMAQIGDFIYKLNEIQPEYAANLDLRALLGV